MELQTFLNSIRGPKAVGDNCTHFYLTWSSSKQQSFLFPSRSQCVPRVECASSGSSWCCKRKMNQMNNYGCEKADNCNTW